jgi:PAS domain S-box-containing protein
VWHPSGSKNILVQEVEVMNASFLFEHVSDPIVILDRDFRVIRANPGFYRFFGVTEGQIRGQKSCDLFKELNFSRCNEACMRVIRKEVEGGKWVEVPDEHCPHFDHVYPIFDEQGRLQEAMFILKTADAREKAEEWSPAAAGKVKLDGMLATIYHDLASPLQVIRACMDVMEMELEENPEGKKELMRDMLEASKRNERRLYEMVQTIRMIPGLEEDDIYRSQPIRPDTAAETVCGDFRLVLRDDVALDVEIPPDLPNVMMDPELLNRVLFNLLDNAARYTRTGGRIAVSAHHEPGNTHVTFRVFDDGDAIPAELQSRIFERNQTFDLSKRGPNFRKDHGWGLYFCRLVIERFGGSIWVESKDGWGTRFSFTIPVESSSHHACTE